MTDLYLNRKLKIKVTDSKTSEFLEVEDLRITFETQKTIDSLPNVGVIKIYNPSLDFVNFSSRENLKVDVLTAYFEEEFDILFLGDLKRSYFPNIDVDNLFVMEVGDSENAIANSFINKSYTKGVKKKAIVQDCINILGVDILATTLNRITGSYNGGFVAFGKVMDNLDIIINSLGFEETNSNDFITVDYENGLLKKPIPLQDGGFLLNCLLETKYLVHNTIFLNIPGYEGFFQIRQINFFGDNERNQWEANLICQ
jgi:hypothetical protein